MTRTGASVLTACALVCASCAAPSPAPLVEVRNCSYQENEQHICDALKQVQVRTPEGLVSTLSTTQCRVWFSGHHYARVTWQGAGQAPRTQIVSFDDRGDLYVPVRVVPDIRAWPCEEDTCRATEQPRSEIASVPIIPACEGVPPRRVDVAVTPPGQAPQCKRAQEIFPYTDAVPCWSKDPTPGYHLEMHGAFGEMQLVDVRPDGATMWDRRGRSHEVPRAVADALRARLDAELWTLPFEGGHCGRDGFGYVAYGRRNGHFRRIVRSCADIAETLPLLSELPGSPVGRYWRRKPTNATRPAPPVASGAIAPPASSPEVTTEPQSLAP